MRRLLRLRRAGDFAHVRRAGKSLHRPMVIVSCVPNSLGHNRYGFIVSKRLGNAVMRNRIKRLLREAVRLLHPQLTGGFDVVFVARPAIVGQPFALVLRTVGQVLVQAGLMPEETSS